MFLDIAVGILLAVWASAHFNVALSLFLVVTTIFFVLFPDLDFLIELFKHDNVGGRVIREHRRISHYPLIYIPIAAFIFLIFGKFWGLLFSLAIVLHFIHDGIGFGWGTQWFWPFSKNHYIFFRKSLYSEKPGLSFSFLYIWTPEQAETMAAEYGDPHWIKNFYFRPNLILAVEILILATAIFIVLNYPQYYK